MEEIIKALITALSISGSFTQLEQYDGQFEAGDLGEWQILPPACFINVVRSECNTSGSVLDRWTIDLIVVASHISGSGSSTLAISDLISEVKDKTHNQDLFYDSAHLGRMFYTFAEEYVNLPGLKVWKVNITLN